MDSSASPSDFSKFEQYINKFPTNSMDSLKDKYATSAGTEHSFSCLKRIKTHLRNSQSQNRLSDLSLLAIEKRLLTTVQNQNLFYDNVIDDFTKKTRRIDLLYK
eukprot:XP_016661900.1 PREDICTED: zinc finger MYM-type protein 1-like isoform X2 [Acyrthosiphon pisum]